MSIADKLTTIAENEQKVYDAGAKSEYDKFWDNIQNYGKQKSYQYLFGGRAWTPDTFKPKYSFNASDYRYAFWYFGDPNKPIDLLALEKEQNITMRYKGVYTYTFAYANVTTVPTVDVSVGYGTPYLHCTFYNNNRVHTIEKIILYSDLDNHQFTEFLNTFTSATALKNIKFENLIGKTISLGQSPLSVESAKNVIEHLVDYSETQYNMTYKLTLRYDVWTALNNAEAPPSGDTWQLYVNSLGWNCA